MRDHVRAVWADRLNLPCRFGAGRRVVHADRDFYYAAEGTTGRDSQWRILEVRKNGDTDPLKQYVWGRRYVHSPVVRWRDGNTDGDYDDTGDDTLYYCNDANFNVTAVIDGDPTSGTVGEVVERYAYDPYGAVTVLDADWTEDGNNASDVDNRILYCGYRLDTETGAAGQGLYHVRNRHYLPPLGRWTSRDIEGYVDGMSLYAYAINSPIDMIDWLGMQATATSQPATNEPTTRPESRPAEPPILDMTDALQGACPLKPTSLTEGTVLRVVIDGLGSITELAGAWEDGCAELTYTITGVQSALKYTDIQPWFVQGNTPCKFFKDKIDTALKRIQADLVGNEHKLDVPCTQIVKEDGEKVEKEDPDQRCCPYRAFTGKAYTLSIQINDTYGAGGLVAKRFMGRKSVPRREKGKCKITGTIDVSFTAQGVLGKCVKK